MLITLKPPKKFPRKCHCFLKKLFRKVPKNGNLIFWVPKNKVKMAV